MHSAFGVEHEISKAGDYQRASATWQRRSDRGDHVENAATAIGGGTGVLAGAAQARDRYAKQNPEQMRRMTLRATALPKSVGERLVRGKPGAKTLVVGTTAAATALAAGQYRKTAERKAKSYREHPNASLSKAVGAVAPEELQRRKKVQGALGTTAAAVGLTAFGAKTGARLLPKITKGGVKGKSYAKHLDRAADHVLFAGAGIGGTAGLHQGSLYRQESKQKIVKALSDGRNAKDPSNWAKESPGAAQIKLAARQKKLLAGAKLVAKAYDPERSRRRRSKGYEAAAATGAVGLGAAAARPNTKLVVRGMKESRDASNTAKVKYAQGRQMLEGSHPKPAQARAALDQAGVYRKAAKKVASLHPSPVAGKQRLVLAGAAVASGAGAAAIHAQRNGSGKPYASWFDRAKKSKTSAPERVSVSAQGRKPGWQASERTRLPGESPRPQMDDHAAAAWQARMKKS